MVICNGSHRKLIQMASHACLAVGKLVGLSWNDSFLFISSKVVLHKVSQGSKEKGEIRPQYTSTFQLFAYVTFVIVLSAKASLMAMDKDRVREETIKDMRTGRLESLGAITVTCYHN